MKNTIKLTIGIFLLFFSCNSDNDSVNNSDVVELNTQQVKAWYSSDLQLKANKYLILNNISWDWDESVTISDKIYRVESSDVEHEGTSFRMDVVLENNLFIPVFYGFLEHELPSGDLSIQEVSFNQAGEILYSKNEIAEDFWKHNRKKLLGLASYNENGGGCCSGFSWSPSLGAFLLDEVTVVGFNNSSLNSPYATSNIYVGSVRNFVGNFRGISTNNYIMPNGYDIYDGTRSGGGGTGQGLGSNEADALYDIDNNYEGPDCGAFVFTKTTTDAHWQNSAVYDINFKIGYVLPPSIVRVTHTVNIPGTVLFGMPTNHRNGGNVDPGSAAETTARVVQEAMRLTARHYYNRAAQPSDVERFFMDTLKAEYPKYTDGGRVQTNVTNSPVAANQYSSLPGSNIGNCN